MLLISLCKLCYYSFLFFLVHRHTHKKKLFANSTGSSNDLGSTKQKLGASETREGMSKVVVVGEGAENGSSSFFLSSLSLFYFTDLCVCVYVPAAVECGKPWCPRKALLSLLKEEGVCPEALSSSPSTCVERLKKSNKKRRPFSKRLIRSSARQFSPLFGRRRRSFLFYLSRGVPTVKKASAPSPLNSTSPSCRKLKEGEK